MDNIIKGQIGESAAVKFLENKGYKIICTNWATRMGEIDIVAEINGVTAFVEVKARASLKYGFPAEAVDRNKQHKLSMMAVQYIKAHKLFDMPARFDVIEITGYGVRHIENAFESTIRM